jgi:SP family facilitated glucose transporter-like MFS transporter 8
LQVYVAEISSSQTRGALGTIHQTSLTTGILLSYIIGVFYGWRIIALVGAIMPAVLVVVMIFLTETPRWYLAHNKRSAALKSLLWLRGPEADIEEECFEIERTIGWYR